MSKDPTPKADGLRAMREETRGHLQATVKPLDAGEMFKTSSTRDALAPPPPKKLIAYAGKERHQGGVPFSKRPRPPNDKPTRNRRNYKRKIT